MQMQLMVHITGKEVYESLSMISEVRFDRFLSNFRPEDGLVILANACVLLGIFTETSRRTVHFDGKDYPANVYIQSVLAKNLLSPSILDRLMSPRFAGRPVFFRQQLLFLIKKLLIHGTPEGSLSPQANRQDIFALGRMCLEITNFMDPERPELSSNDGSHNNEKIRNSLVSRLSPGYELLHPPAFQTGVVRS